MQPLFRLAGGGNHFLDLLECLELFIARAGGWRLCVRNPPPLDRVCRLSLVDSTVPVKGTHTGAGLLRLVGGTTTKALFVPSIGKSTLRPRCGTFDVHSH